MQNRVVLLGSSGGVGSALHREFLSKKYNVICVNRSNVDLLSPNAEDQLHEILSTHQPDIVVNCCGVLGDNSIDFDKIFTVNVKTNWSILSYYKNNPPQKVVKFITIGSSSYESGRRDYILYAATKAALFNIYQGASEYFADKNLVIGLVNPGRIRTQLIQHLLKDGMVCLEPEDVARRITNFLGSLQKSSYININN